MKTFILGMMTGLVGAHMLMDNKKSMMKKGKQAIKNKIDDILD